MTEQGRRTATVQRIDVSASHHGPSAALAAFELLHATVRTGEGQIELRPCVCGGTVKADPDNPAKGVQAHNFTGRHKAWRANREA